MAELPSVEELRALAADVRARAEADQAAQRAAENAAWDAETASIQADLIPRLTEELKGAIARAAQSGRTSTSRIVPSCLPSFPDDGLYPRSEKRGNRQRYVPVLEGAADNIRALDPAYKVDYKYNTGMEWGSDGGFSDGICHVEIWISWGQA